MGAYRIINLETVDSTNDYIKELLHEGSAMPLLVSASRQSGGRGRHGRSFFSPPGGIYMSFAFDACAVSGEDLLAITPITAILVRRAIESIIFPRALPAIKWVNDIYIGGKKVSGVLTELFTDRSGFDHVIIGIGINFVRSDVPEDLKDIIGFVSDSMIDMSHSASGACASEKMLNISEYRSSLVTELANSLNETFASGRKSERASYLAEYRKYCDTLGKKIAVRRRDGTVRPGIAVDINDDFELIFAPAGKNQTERLSSVEASITVII